ncbi:clathrin assembly complex, medium subunit, partial [Ochromonadaceae sp. CCMP2298]
EVLIEKHWRGVTSRSVCEHFWNEVNKYDSKDEMPPIVAAGKHYLISILREDIFMIATTASETQPLLIIELLHRIFEIFDEYLGGVDEATIKDNFSLVYQLLEEMMDFGYPLTMEPNALKAMIKPPTVISRLASTLGGSTNVSDVLPDGTISNMPWRKTGVQYSQNEIYLDIIEEIDAIVDRHGQVITSEVNGVIAANAKLSGVPDLTLSFSDPGVIDDCSFHPCVRYSRFERDKVVSFVPPDGVFELMRYRVNTHGNVVAPCYCQPQFSFDPANNQGSVNVVLGIKTVNSLVFPGSKPALVVEDVEVLIPFSRSVRTANLKATTGTVLFDEASKVARWTIGKLQEDSKYPTLSGTILLHPNSVSQEAPAVQLGWRVPLASVSGLSVASLQLSNERYKPYKGVRTVAKSGKFQVRSV